MKFLKNKKGSQLVEKIMMVAFSVAAGGAVIIYGANVINASKETYIAGIDVYDNENRFNQEERKISFNASELDSHTWEGLTEAISNNSVSLFRTTLYYNDMPFNFQYNTFHSPGHYGEDFVESYYTPDDSIEEYYRITFNIEVKTPRGGFNETFDNKFHLYFDATDNHGDVQELRFHGTATWTFNTDQDYLAMKNALFPGT